MRASARHTSLLKEKSLLRRKTFHLRIISLLSVIKTGVRRDYPFLLCWTSLNHLLLSWYLPTAHRENQHSTNLGRTVYNHTNGKIKISNVYIYLTYFALRLP